jgi:hypothetical protein
MTISDNIKPGLQVAYIPRHAKGSINHPDVEFGFVLTPVSHGVFCRFWYRDFTKGLRTTANSELVDYELLEPHISHPQSEVDYIIEKIQAGVSLC